MRFLIVDEAREPRAALAALLRARWPDAEMNEWDPDSQGSPREAIAHGDYSAVLLSAQVRDDAVIAWDDAAIAMVAEICGDPGSPPLLLLSDEGGETLAVKAIKAGASDFLLRAGLDAERLAQAVVDGMSERAAIGRDASGRERQRTITVKLAALRDAHADRTGPPSVPGYRALRLIGEGGSSRVYLAERVHDGKTLVLKVLDSSLRDDKVFMARFVQEYKLLAGLHDEHVAQIYDQGFAGSHPYIAMEYLPGGDLKAKIIEGLAPRQALRLLGQIAKALDAIHRHGIVHRDLKPQNILFRGNGVPVIVDFGMARSLASDITLARSGQMIATVRYLSPEQCLGQPADARSDLYSLGVMFYEMLTRKRLYESSNDREILRLHVKGEPPKLKPPLTGYQRVLDRLLAKDPAKRYQSARELFANIAI